MADKVRVLLVDDEELFVENLARILEGRGLEVSRAFDGLEAVSLIKQDSRFDVAVLDIKMPGLDGLEALKEIKKKAPDIEVIMLTGHATLNSGIEAMRQGAYDYLIKPCDIDDLTEKIREAHKLASIRREPILGTGKTVGEVTQPGIFALAPEDTMDDAVEAMSPWSDGEAPDEICVIDQEDRLLGLVTRRILIEEAQSLNPEVELNWDDLQENPELLPDKTLSEVMRPPLTTAAPDEMLADVIRIMIECNLRRLPVMDGSVLTGIIRMKDIFKYIDREIE